MFVSVLSRSFLTTFRHLQRLLSVEWYDMAVTLGEFELIVEGAEKSTANKTRSVTMIGFLDSRPEFEQDTSRIQIE